MLRLLFLSRVAFVCNVFFALALSLQFTRWFQNQDAESTVIVIGYFLAMLLNPLAVCSYLFLLVRHKNKLPIIPLWLRIANAVFLLFQLFFIFHLNAQ